MKKFEKLSDYNHKYAAEHLMEFTIVPEIINTEKVKETLCGFQLEELPHRNILDMSVVYRIVMEFGQEIGTAVDMITNDMLNGRTEEELFQAAMKTIEADGIWQSKTRRLSDYLIELRGYIDEDDEGIDPPLYYLGNDTQKFGAAAIANKKILDKVYQDFGSSFYIIPSSIHEVLLLNENDEEVKQRLRVEYLPYQLLQPINEDIVAVKDRLSNSVYRYNGETKALEFAARGEAL